MSVQNSKTGQPKVVAKVVSQPQALVTPKTDGEWHSVKASSFADVADVIAFRAAKAKGWTDMQAFAVGDNGVGFAAMPVESNDTWVPMEDDNDARINCGTERVCACALPPEIWMPKWGSVKAAAGKRVVVRYKGKVVPGILGDTMPHLRNIKNGAGIDLNPGFAKAFGINPPFMIGVQWSWA